MKEDVVVIGPPNWRKRIAWGLAILMVLAAAALGTYVVAKPKIFEWRAKRLSAQALEALAAGDTTAAYQKALAAYQMAPAAEDAQRALARVYAKIRHPDTATVYGMLRDSDAMKNADRLDFARFQLKTGNFPGARRTIAEALELVPQDPPIVLLSAELAIFLQDFAAGEKLLNEIPESAPEHPQAMLLLGRMLATSFDPDRRDEAVKILSTLSRTTTRQSREALRFLVQLPWLSRQEFDAAVKQLEESKSGEDRLLASAMKIRRDPASAGEVIAKLEKRYGAAEAAERREFASWLVQIGRPEDALRFLPESEAVTRKDMFLVRLDALAALGRWQAIADVLSTGKPPIEESIVSLYRGRAAAELGDELGAKRFYEKAVADAARSPAELTYIAAYFREIRQRDLAFKALQELSQNPTTARPAFEAMLTIAKTQRDDAKLEAILDEMAERWPRDTAVQNDRRYLRLLHGKAAPGAADRARSLVQENPASLPFRTTLALALLLEGKTAQALDVYVDLEVDWPRVNPAQRAIFVATLGRNGMTDAARSFGKGLSPRSLRPEELRLAEPWLPSAD